MTTTHRPVAAARPRDDRARQTVRALARLAPDDVDGDVAPHGRVSRRRPGAGSGRIVAVIDDDDLEDGANSGTGGGDPRQQLTDAALLVPRGHDDRYPVGEAWLYAPPSDLLCLVREVDRTARHIRIANVHRPSLTCR